ncbi:tRNA pseudouridine(55) synthase [hydrothermal vent metagenome]|uniref:tRNA pseudouridine(55) synthase n=1 Tax=hydrothermal vent metagenome TaxID=652676 RepID=A0A3B0TD72_9ZZZZ
MKNDILLVDKPKGITSFDVIRRLRKKLGIRKMGHAGTLDPLATGLLIIGVADGTKKLKDLIGLPKTYETEILVGRRTKTGDMEGEVVESKKVESLKIEEVAKVLEEMVGVLKLPVPVYSAIKKEGKPLYKYARQGKEVDVPIKEMKIYGMELLGVVCGDGECVVSVRMDVGSGTYVRSVAEEVGKRLGFPATVKELRRTKVGEFDVKDAQEV